MIRSLCVAVVSLLCLVACGPPVATRDDAAAILAHSAVPATQAQQTAVRVAASSDTLPQPTLQLYGANGGHVVIEFNLVGAVVGLVGEGILFNMHYSDYSNDGALRLNGDVAVLANFQYVGEPESGVDPYADLKLTLAGRARLSGIVHDDLHARIALTTRFHDLQFQEQDSVSMRLDGYVEGDGGRFEFAQEDVTAAWDAFVDGR